MPRSLTTGVFTRVSNSFSDPVYGTVIDPTDAISLFDDQDGGMTFKDAQPLILIGSTSGILTILAPDTASGTITLPAGTTNFSATGGTGQYVKQASVGAPFTVAAISASEITSGILPLANGGTNANLTASIGGIFYSTIDAGAILSGTATARQMLQSGASAAPAWSTSTWPATTTLNRLLYSTATNVVGEITTGAGGVLASPGGVPGWTATPTLGTAGSVVGTIAFANATSGTVTIQPVVGALGSTVMSLPAANDTFVGKATTDILTNKTIGTGNTLSPLDGSFAIPNTSDPTKIAKFSSSVITTGTTRTYTLPDNNTTLVGKDTTDTLTNKTFDTAGTGNSFSINSVAVTANTGTGAVARAAGPTFTTPILGVATATSVNKVAITAPATSATITVQDGKTLSYSEGTWTPAVTAAGTPGTPSYSIQGGFYRKIGTFVEVHFAIVLSGWTGSPSGNATITGLPFTSTSTANDNGGVSFNFYIVAGLAALNYGLVGFISPSTTVININSSGSAGTTTVTAAHLGTTPSLYGFANYHTDS